MSGSEATAVRKPQVYISESVLPEDLKETRGPVEQKKPEPKPDLFVKDGGHGSHSKEKIADRDLWMAPAARLLGEKPNPKNVAMTSEQFDRVKGERVDATLKMKIPSHGGWKEIAVPLEGVYHATFGELGDGPQGAPTGSGLHAVVQTNGVFYLNDSQFATVQQKIAEARGLARGKKPPSPGRAPAASPENMIAKNEGAKGKPLYRQSVGSLKSVSPPESKAPATEKKEKEDELGRLIRESDEKWRANSGKSNNFASTPGENRMKPFISEEANQWKTRPSPE